MERPQLESPEMRKPSDELKLDFYHERSDPPSELLTPQYETEEDRPEDLDDEITLKLNQLIRSKQEQQSRIEQNMSVQSDHSFTPDKHSQLYTESPEVETIDRTKEGQDLSSIKAQLHPQFPKPGSFLSVRSEMDFSIFDEPPMRKSHQGPIETEQDLLEELKTQMMKLKEVLKREIAHKFILVERC